MVAKMMMDKGVSILPESQFNYNGSAVEDITDDMAREVLNFTIAKKQTMVDIDGVMMAVPRNYCLVRSDGGIIDANCSVGEEFEVTSQPTETYEFARFVMANMPNVKIQTVATMYNGGSTFVNLTQGDSWLVRGDTSPHHTNLLLCNPLTRGKFHIVSHSVRVVCMNTLQAAMREGEGYRISHTKNARQMVELALEQIRLELEAADSLRQKCEFLASKSITSEKVDALMDILYPLPQVKENARNNGLTLMQNKRTEVLNQFESDKSFTDKTYYTFLNANTYMLEHPLHAQKRTDATQIAYENIVGTRANRKGEILEAVYTMANAS